MTVSQLQDLLMSQFSIRKDEDGDFRIALSADDDYPHDVICFVRMRDSLIRIFCMSGGYYDLSGSDAAHLQPLINDWNYNKYWPKAYLAQSNDGSWRVEAESVIIVDDDKNIVSDSAVLEFVKRNLSGMWHLFVNLHKGKIE